MAKRSAVERNNKRKRMVVKYAAKRAELKALPIRGLPPMPLGWAARDFGLLSTTAREFLSLFDRRLT